MERCNAIFFFTFESLQKKTNKTNKTKQKQRNPKTLDDYFKSYLDLIIVSSFINELFDYQDDSYFTDDVTIDDGLISIKTDIAGRIANASTG